MLQVRMALKYMNTSRLITRYDHTVLRRARFSYKKHGWNYGIYGLGFIMPVDNLQVFRKQYPEEHLAGRVRKNISDLGSYYRAPGRFFSEQPLCTEALPYNSLNHHRPLPITWPFPLWWFQGIPAESQFDWGNLFPCLYDVSSDRTVLLFLWFCPYSGYKKYMYVSRLMGCQENEAEHHYRQKPQRNSRHWPPNWGTKLCEERE